MRALGFGEATQTYQGKSKDHAEFPFSAAMSSIRSPSPICTCYGKHLVLNVAPVRDASAGSKQPGPVVERQKKLKWCSVIVATVVGDIGTQWQGREAEFLCKAQVLLKRGHNYLIQTHFRWTGWFSPSSAGATHRHEGTEACEDHNYPIMGLQD